MLSWQALQRLVHHIICDSGALFPPNLLALVRLLMVRESHRRGGDTSVGGHGDTCDSGGACSGCCRLRRREVVSSCRCVSRSAAAATAVHTAAAAADTAVVCTAPAVVRAAAAAACHKSL